MKKTTDFCLLLLLIICVGFYSCSSDNSEYEKYIDEALESSRLIRSVQWNDGVHRDSVSFTNLDCPDGSSVYCESQKYYRDGELVSTFTISDRFGSFAYMVVDSNNGQLPFNIVEKQETSDSYTWPEVYLNKTLIGDNSGQTDTIYFDPNADDAGLLSRSHTTAYSATPRRISEIRYQDGGIDRFYYDVSDNLVRLEQCDGAVITYTYDENFGFIVLDKTKYIWLNPIFTPYVFKWPGNFRNNILSETVISPEGVTETTLYSYTYDEVGIPMSMTVTKPDGKVTEYRVNYNLKKLNQIRQEIKEMPERGW